jgi:hypothetical protein
VVSNWPLSPLVAEQTIAECNDKLARYPPVAFNGHRDEVLVSGYLSGGIPEWRSNHLYLSFFIADIK